MALWCRFAKISIRSIFLYLCFFFNATLYYSDSWLWQQAEQLLPWQCAAINGRLFLESEHFIMILSIYIIMFYLSEMYLSKCAKCITNKILKKTINNYLLHFLLITITMTMVFSFLPRFLKIIFLTSYLYLYWEPFFKVTRRSLCELGFRGPFSGALLTIIFKAL